MFYLSMPTKTLVMGRASAQSRLLMEALRAAGPAHLCRNPRMAAAIVRNITDELAIFEPQVTALDSDRARTSMGAERLLRVSSGIGLATLESAPPPVSVLVALAPASGSAALVQSKVFESISVRRIIVTTRADRAAQEALHEGLVDGLAFLKAGGNTEDIAEIVALVRSQRRAYDRDRFSKVATLLANGTTSFLREQTVLDLIHSTAQQASAEEVFLSLEPPGVLIRAERKPSIFLFICDDVYRTGLQEIAALARQDADTIQSTLRDRSSRRAEELEFAQHLAWVKILKGARRIGTDIRWHYKKLAINDLPAHVRAQLRQSPAPERT